MAMTTISTLVMTTIASAIMTAPKIIAAVQPEKLMPLVALIIPATTPIITAMAIISELATISSSVSSTGSSEGNNSSRSPCKTSRGNGSRTHRKYNRFLSLDSYKSKSLVSPPSSVSPELNAVTKTAATSASSSKTNSPQNKTHTNMIKTKLRVVSSTKSTNKAWPINKPGNSFDDDSKFTTGSASPYKLSLSLFSEDDQDFFNDQEYNGDSENGQFAASSGRPSSIFSPNFRQRSVSPASSLSSTFGEESSTLILKEDRNPDSDEEVEDFDIEHEEEYFKNYYSLSPSSHDSSCSTYLKNPQRSTTENLQTKLKPIDASKSLQPPQRSGSLKRISRKARQPIHYSQQHPLTNTNTFEKDIYDPKDDQTESLSKTRRDSVNSQRDSSSTFIMTNLYISSDERGYLASDSNYESLYEEEEEEEEVNEEYKEDELVRPNNFQRTYSISHSDSRILNSSDSSIITINRHQEASPHENSPSSSPETLVPSPLKVSLSSDISKPILEKVYHSPPSTYKSPPNINSPLSCSSDNTTKPDTSKPEKSGNSSLEPQQTIPEPKKSIVSNFTASIRALTQAASSLSNSQTSTMLLAFSPRSTDEHLPTYDTTTSMVLNEDETREEFDQANQLEKDCANKVDNTKRVSSPPSSLSLASSDEIMTVPRKLSKPKCIQLTTYKFVSTPLPNPLPARPREPRLNPAFLRIYAIETVMRINGKLESNQEGISNSRAFKTMILPARNNTKSITGQKVVDGTDSDRGFVRKCFFTGFDLGGERWSKKSGSPRQRVKLLFDSRSLE
ncbi:hypothetical protein NADFUDRAFT_82041 [Nadsonia fulvescens var. elongata DSM 6958]|uniref:Uncharacterized protein n=1 Tax=Nadsonia fulvescens var. elongata DSM 6958 TaxID=857566 RepID=A0A1E3PQ91_9ASCO|nr:hypothetical protein NADFUDRAFT_82041 [Nadsonia fulvescens var. elongata DSM 6958]